LFGIIQALWHRTILVLPVKWLLILLALEKVRDLSKYISIVGNKDTPWSEANSVIERTLELFADGAMMGVSSINREEVNYYGVREYLERLMALTMIR
jgi:hypothetical protein